MLAPSCVFMALMLLLFAPCLTMPSKDDTISRMEKQLRGLQQMRKLPHPVTAQSHLIELADEDAVDRSTRVQLDDHSENMGNFVSVDAETIAAPSPLIVVADPSDIADKSLISNANDQNNVTAASDLMGNSTLESSTPAITDDNSAPNNSTGKNDNLSDNTSVDSVKEKFLVELARRILDVRKQGYSQTSFIIHPENSPLPTYRPLYAPHSISHSFRKIAENNNLLSASHRLDHPKAFASNDPEENILISSIETDRVGDSVSETSSTIDTTTEFNSQGSSLFKMHAHTTLLGSQDSLIEKLQPGPENEPLVTSLVTQLKEILGNASLKNNESLDDPNIHSSAEESSTTNRNIETTSSTDRTSFEVSSDETDSTTAAATSSPYASSTTKVDDTIQDEVANFLKSVASGSGFQTAFVGDLIKNFSSLNHNAMKLLYNLLIDPLNSSSGTKTSSSPSLTDTIFSKSDISNNSESSAFEPSEQVANSIFLASNEKIGDGWLPYRSTSRSSRGNANIEVITAPPTKRFQLVVGSSLNSEPRKSSSFQRRSGLPNINNLRMGVGMPPPEALEALPPGAQIVLPSQIHRRPTIPKISFDENNIPVPVHETRPASRPESNQSPMSALTALPNFIASLFSSRPVERQRPDRIQKQDQQTLTRNQPQQRRPLPQNLKLQQRDRLFASGQSLQHHQQPLQHQQRRRLQLLQQQRLQQRLQQQQRPFIRNDHVTNMHAPGPYPVPKLTHFEAPEQETYEKIPTFTSVSETVPANNQFPKFEDYVQSSVYHHSSDESYVPDDDAPIGYFSGPSLEGGFSPVTHEQPQESVRNDAADQQAQSTHFAVHTSEHSDTSKDRIDLESFDHPHSEDIIERYQWDKPRNDYDSRPFSADQHFYDHDDSFRVHRDDENTTYNDDKNALFSDYDYYHSDFVRQGENTQHSGDSSNKSPSDTRENDQSFVYYEESPNTSVDSETIVQTPFEYHEHVIQPKPVSSIENTTHLLSPPTSIASKDDYNYMHRDYNVDDYAYLYDFPPDTPGYIEFSSKKIVNEKTFDATAPADSVNKDNANNRREESSLTLKDDSKIKNDDAKKNSHMASDGDAPSTPVRIQDSTRMRDHNSASTHNLKEQGSRVRNYDIVTRRGGGDESRYSNDHVVNRQDDIEIDSGRRKHYTSTRQDSEEKGSHASDSDAGRDRDHIGKENREINHNATHSQHDGRDKFRVMKKPDTLIKPSDLEKESQMSNTDDRQDGVEGGSHLDYYESFDDSRTGESSQIYIAHDTNMPPTIEKAPDHRFDESELEYAPEYYEYAYYDPHDYAKVDIYDQGVSPGNLPVPNDGGESRIIDQSPLDASYDDHRNSGDFVVREEASSVNAGYVRSTNQSRVFNHNLAKSHEHDTAANKNPSTTKAVYMQDPVEPVDSLSEININQMFADDVQRVDDPLLEQRDHPVENSRGYRRPPIPDPDSSATYLFNTIDLVPHSADLFNTRHVVDENKNNIPVLRNTTQRHFNFTLSEMNDIVDELSPANEFMAYVLIGSCVGLALLSITGVLLIVRFKKSCGSRQIRARQRLKKGSLPEVTHVPETFLESDSGGHKLGSWFTGKGGGTFGSSKLRSNMALPSVEDLRRDHPERSSSRRDLLSINSDSSGTASSQRSKSIDGNTDRAKNVPANEKSRGSWMQKEFDASESELNQSAGQDITYISSKHKNAHSREDRSKHSEREIDVPESRHHRQRDPTTSQDTDFSASKYEGESYTTDSEFYDPTSAGEDGRSSRYVDDSQDADTIDKLRSGRSLTTSQELGEKLSHDIRHFQARSSPVTSRDSSVEKDRRRNHEEGNLNRSTSEASFTRDTVQNEVFLEFDNIFKQHGQYLTTSDGQQSSLERASDGGGGGGHGDKRSNSPDSIETPKPSAVVPDRRRTSDHVGSGGSRRHGGRHHRTRSTSISSKVVGSTASPPTPPRFTPPPPPPRPPKPERLCKPALQQPSGDDDIEQGRLGRDDRLV